VGELSPCETYSFVRLLQHLPATSRAAAHLLIQKVPPICAHAGAHASTGSALSAPASATRAPRSSALPLKPPPCAPACCRSAAAPLAVLRPATAAGMPTPAMSGSRAPSNASSCSSATAACSQGGRSRMQGWWVGGRAGRKGQARILEQEKQLMDKVWPRPCNPVAMAWEAPTSTSPGSCAAAASTSHSSDTTPAASRRQP
jgi:hypothetical protein